MGQGSALGRSVRSHWNSEAAGGRPGENSQERKAEGSQGPGHVKLSQAILKTLVFTPSEVRSHSSDCFGKDWKQQGRE